MEVNTLPKPSNSVENGCHLMRKLNEIPLYKDLEIVCETSKLMVDKLKQKHNSIRERERETEISTQLDCLILQNNLSTQLGYKVSL